jgi:hypothetical protein
VAPLIDSAETSFGTDFAIVSARQEQAEPDDIPTFAYTGPGFVRLEAGNKYSRVHIRVERWDERPPAADGWEDVDELPFAEVPDGGKLVLHGFDPSDVGIDISGFGLGRVQVFAHGRHRYSYGDSSIDVDKSEPEEWLLRLYPHQGAHDPMAGGPRRIAGSGGLGYSPRTAWDAAMLGYRTAGWDRELGNSHGYYLAHLAMYEAREAVTRHKLASLMVKWMAPWQLGGDESESIAVPPRPSLRAAPDPLATHSGRESIATIGDVIDALIEIGLILLEERGDSRVVVPNPSPEPVWSRLGMTGDALRRARVAALEGQHRRTASMIEASARWCVGGLTASPRSMAIRWCTSVEDVLGALRVLAGTDRITANRELDLDVDVDLDEPLTVQARGRTLAM